MDRPTWVIGALLCLVAPGCDERGRAPPDSRAPEADVDPVDGRADTDATDTGGPDGAGPDGDEPVYVIDAAPPPAVRRLSTRELENTYAAVVGMVPKALAQVPPDPRDFTFDRVVNAQTVSPRHAEAYDAAASEAADWLLAERRFDDIAPECTDAIMPPAIGPSSTETRGIGLAAYPDWALNPGDGNPDRLMIRYAEESGVSTSYAAPIDGRYRVLLHVELEPSFDVTLSIDGVVAASWHTTGAQLLETEVELTAGSHLVAYDFVYDGSSNPYVWVQALGVDGPIDAGAGRDDVARTACTGKLIDALMARAYRRPPTDTERERLRTRIGDTADWGEQIKVAIRAILGSPKFLYLVETGTAVAPGRYALDPWQVAQRLSYALCEGPPDAALVAAVNAGELASDAQIAAQAERLMASPCAEATVARFYRQWLWLEKLPQTAKDPALYPDFSSTTAEAFAREADRFLHELTFEEGADITELYLADHSWVDDTTAAVYGLAAPGVGANGALVRTMLPDERSGVLTLPGVLAVTAKFRQTSPVIRGVYVLEQILCDELPAPPDDVDTTPPELDPTLTSRQRWAAHSESLACAPCHQRIDPIGFTFEEFDAMGRHRTSENGLPVDAHGAAPLLGVRDPTLEGVGDLAALVASSERATTCLARQWLRFALGRMEEAPDAGSIAAVAAALKGPDGSLRKGFLALTGTRAFRERIERQEVP